MLGKIEGRGRRRQQRIRWLDSITNSVNMSLSKFREIVKGRETYHATDNRVTKSWRWLSNWTAAVSPFKTMKKKIKLKICWPLYIMLFLLYMKDFLHWQGVLPWSKFSQAPWTLFCTRACLWLVSCVSARILLIQFRKYHLTLNIKSIFSSPPYLWI